MKLLRGILAGAIGTAAMTAAQELAAALQGQGGGGPPETWDEAPAPAQVAKRFADAVGVEVTLDRAPQLTDAMHWGYGLGWGIAYGVLGERLRGGGIVARGLGFGTLVWLSSYAELVPLGIYEPPWEYEPGELALDLAYHLAFGLGVAAASGAA